MFFFFISGCESIWQCSIANIGGYREIIIEDYPIWRRPENIAIDSAKILDFSYHKYLPDKLIRYEEIATLVTFLKESKATYLDLSGNKLCSSEIPILANGLIGSKVKHLSLSDNYLGQRIGKSMKLIQFLQKRKTKLISLDLSYNNLRDEFVIKLAKNLKKLRIRCLNLAYTQIGYNSVIIELAKSIEEGSIEHLNLSENHIPNDGAILLFKSLKISKVTHLNLLMTRIGNMENKTLAYILKELPLKSLNLGMNQIKNDWAIALSEGLKGSKLTKLDLSLNQIENEGAIALAKILPSNLKKITHQLTSNIKYIQLIGNKIKCDGVKALVPFKDIIGGIEFTETMVKEEKDREKLIFWALTKAN